MTKTDKIAIVTGAGSGVGKASSAALAAEGWTLILAGRRPEPLNEVVSEIEAFGGKAIAIPTNVGDPVSVQELFKTTHSRYGRLDLLFNNAGTNAPGVSLEELTYDQWIDVVSINLTGAFLCTQEAFNIMKSQSPMGGRIINNGSVSAHVPRPGSAPYLSLIHISEPTRPY